MSEVESSSPPVATKSLVSQVWNRLRPWRGRLAVSLGLLILAAPLVNFHPLVWGIVADALLDESLTPESLGLWLAIMLGTYLLGIAANAWQSYLLDKTGQAFIRDLRTDLFRKFESQTIDYHRNRSSGELVTRITSDVDAMEQSVLKGMTDLLEEIVTFIVVAGMVLWISPLVGSLSILPLAGAFIFIRLYNQRVKSLYDGVRRRLGHIGAFVQDRLAGIQVTQSFGRESEEQSDFDQRAEQFYESSVAASRLRNRYFPAVSTFGFINNLIMLGAGAWLIMEGSSAFTIGGLLAYRGFWWRLQSPIRTIAQTSDILQRARAAAQRVMELLNEPVEIADELGSRDWLQPRGEIELDGVHFAYRADKPILEGLSVRIEPGEFVAIAGSSGSGKSTLLNLIPRFEDVTGGAVLVDGLNVRNYTLSSLRSPMGLVAQDNYLFDGTIRENLRYGKRGASMEDIEAAARAANAAEFISSLPDGYDTQVGQNGAKLSGGQRQRLSLARAFLAKPVILLLDEPTASVEPESEALIHDSILRRARSGGGTTLLATHQVSMLRQAPRILFLHEGRVLGDGDHNDLLSSCPAYSEAYFRWEFEERVEGVPA